MNVKKLIWLMLVLLAALTQQAKAQCTLDVSISPSPVTLSCSNPSVVVSATVNSGSGTYAYFWYGQGITLGTNSTATFNQPGTYFVQVFDSLQACFSFDTIQVMTDGSIPTVQITTSSDCSGLSQATLSTNAQNPIYNWSTGDTAPTLTNLANGTYCVTVTDGVSGCSVTGCASVFAPAPLIAEISHPQFGYCGDSLGLFASAQQTGVWPWSYAWTTPNGPVTTSWIPAPLLPGDYSVTVTDGNGCTAVASYFLENDPLDCGVIEGHVFADLNNDCLFNGADVGLNQFTVLIQNAAGDEIYAYTHTGGSYSVSLEPGDYSVSVVLGPGLWTPCQSVYLVTVSSNGSTVQELPLQASVVCSDLHVDLTNTILRRCNTNYFWVNYSNQGSAGADNAYVDVQLDPFLTLTAAALPYTNLGSNVFRFDLGAIPMNTSGGFWFQAFLNCNVTPGQTHCTEATIYPHDPCPGANSNWSGASVDLRIDCNGSELKFYAKNTGTAAMSVPLEYVIIEDAVMLSMPAGTPLALGEERLVFTAQSNGATWRMEADQEPFHPGNPHPSVAVEGCTTGQSFSLGYINQFELDDVDGWTDIECRENVASYDPNDKQGFPRGYSTEHYIKPGTDLEYTIRFQNTGTDTAFLVVLRDTLSPFLDPGTVVPGASSHPYRFDYYGDSALKFVFDPIALPDSNVNLLGSEGYVSFKVSQRADVPLESLVTNRAAIYFDANAAVYTNTTKHKVGVNFVTVSTWTPAQNGLELQVMPNPALDYADFQLRGLSAGTNWQVTVFDGTGRKVANQEVSGDQWRLQRGSLPAGMYLIRISSAGKPLGTAKLILR